MIEVRLRLDADCAIPVPSLRQLMHDVTNHQFRDICIAPILEFDPGAQLTIKMREQQHRILRGMTGNYLGIGPRGMTDTFFVYEGGELRTLTNTFALPDYAVIALSGREVHLTGLTEEDEIIMRLTVIPNLLDTIRIVR